MEFKTCRQCSKNKECPQQKAAEIVMGWLSFANVEIDFMHTEFDGCRTIVRPKEAQKAVNIMLLFIYKEMTTKRTTKDLETYLISNLETIGEA